MSEATQRSFFSRMRHTPMRDALRGRITGRLDVEYRLVTSGLPIPAQALIRRVVKRTRLWRIERVEVVDELIAHFLDGIDAGEPVDELIASFGDERAAARLIGRAKRRNRGVVWQALIALRWLACGIIVFYLLSAIYFYSGSPSINVNYVDRLNAPLKDAPADRLAWPLYRQAIPALRGERRINDEGDALLDAKPGSPYWPEAVAWLQSRKQAIELVRQAAQKPTLGFVYGPEGSQRDPDLWPRSDDWKTDADPLLADVLMPNLQDFRQIARVLHADARLAREQGDTARVMRNAETLGKLAGHVREGEVLVAHLVGLGIRHLMLDVIEEALNDSARNPLAPDNLQRLAHQLAHPTTAAELMSFTGDRMAIRDIIQRIYTDNGDGDGRLTPEGARLLKSFMVSHGGFPASWLEPLKVALTTPLLPVLSASRPELTAASERLFDIADANLAHPMRETDWAAYDQQIQSWQESAVDRIQFEPLRQWVRRGMIIAGLSGAQATAERYLGRRDGMLVALALEVYRQRHGDYPSALNDLVPALLPQVPADRITGGPLHYRIVDTKALVYSVGADRDDDEGRPARKRSGEPEPTLAARWHMSAGTAPDGDWVLYSPQPESE